MANLICVPCRRGFSNDMTAEPAASAPRSMIVRGTWPSYFGGGRFRTENGLSKLVVTSRRFGGRWKRLLGRVRTVLLMIAGVTNE